MLIYMVRGYSITWMVGTTFLCTNDYEEIADNIDEIHRFHANKCLEVIELSVSLHAYKLRAV